MIEPVHIINTSRLFLREMVSDDRKSLSDIISDRETMRFYPQPYDESGVTRWLNWSIENYRTFGFGLWAVCLRSSGEMIGDCGITIQNINGTFRPEIGYHINKKFWRNGYAHEAALAVRDWGFTNTPFAALYSYMNSKNIPSYSTAASVGMHFIEEFKVDDSQSDFVYRITRDEWKENRIINDIIR